MILNDKENETKVEDGTKENPREVPSSGGIINNMDAINYQLREPVSSIFAFLPILAENINNGETEKANKNLQSLYEKAYIMLKNVNNISLAAKLSSKEELTASLVDFSSLVESAFKGAEMVLPSYVKISTDLQSGAIVKGNSALLSNGMFNLLLNSIEYKKEGNVEVQVKLKLAGDRCVLTYSDNSLGIKPTVAPFIFDFYYSHNPYDDGEVSTKLGLGLFIAKAAIENAKGSFIFQSEFDGGVKYGISIPLCNNDGGDILKSKPKDFVMNRYSEMFVQLCEYCTLPDLC